MTPIFFADNTFEIVISSPETSVEDICTHKVLVKKLEDPEDATLYESNGSKKEIAIDMASSFHSYLRSDSKLKFFLRSPPKVQANSAAVSEHWKRDTTGEMELEGTLSVHFNREKRNRRPEISPFEEEEREDPVARGSAPEPTVLIESQTPTISQTAESPSSTISIPEPEDEEPRGRARAGAQSFSNTLDDFLILESPRRPSSPTPSPFDEPAPKPQPVPKPEPPLKEAPVVKVCPSSKIIMMLFYFFVLDSTTFSLSPPEALRD